MIYNIPSANEFYESGLRMLNLACDFVFSELRAKKVFLDQLPLDTEDLTSFQDDHKSSVKDVFLNSLVLVQQATELILKSKIAQVSPFILLAGTPRDWPRGSEKNDADFSEFRTIDAQDLVKTINTFSRVRLPDEFTKWHNELRKKRNTIIHGVHTHVDIKPEDILENALSAYTFLVDSPIWIQQRRQHHSKTSDAVISAYACDFAYDIYVLTEEIGILVSLLDSSRIKELIGLDTKREYYLCPKCLSAYRHDPLEIGFAQIEEMNECKLSCPICGESSDIFYGACPCGDCNNNIFAKDHHYINKEDDYPFVCLKCGNTMDSRIPDLHDSTEKTL